MTFEFLEFRVNFASVGSEVKSTQTQDFAIPERYKLRCFKRRPLIIVGN